MKKEVFVLLFLASLTFLFLMKPVAAQIFDGYGDIGGYDGRISLADFFDSLDPSTVTYGLLFFIFFTIIFLILTKINLFRGRRNYFGIEEPNTTAAGIVAFSISALIVYYMYRSGYNLESYFYDWGFSVDLFSFLLLAVFLIVAFVIIKRFRLGGFFIVLGLLFIFAGFIKLVYEWETSILLGAVFLIVGIFLAKNARKWWKRHMRTY